jgi:hypothetical protein
MRIPSQGYALNQELHNATICGTDLETTSRTDVDDVRVAGVGCKQSVADRTTELLFPFWRDQVPGHRRDAVVVLTFGADGIEHLAVTPLSSQQVSSPDSGSACPFCQQPILPSSRPRLPVVLFEDLQNLPGYLTGLCGALGVQRNQVDIFVRPLSFWEELRQ